MAWQYPLRCLVGTKEDYTNLITDLSRALRTLGENGQEVDDILREDPGAYPVLRTQSTTAQRWLCIELMAVVDQETFRTALAIRDDNVYCKGFRNRNGTWYELSGPKPKNRPMLPLQSKVQIWWDVSYSKIMGVSDRVQVKNSLESAWFGRNFAAQAVRRLARYPDLDDGDEFLTRNSLAGLIVMVCESARFNALFYAIAGGWDRGTRLTSGLLDYIWGWRDISCGLLKWRMDQHRLPCINQWITSAGSALSPIHLVLKCSDKLVASRIKNIKTSSGVPASSQQHSQSKYAPPKSNPSPASREKKIWALKNQVQQGRDESLEDENAPDPASQQHQPEEGDREISQAQPEEDVNASDPDQPGEGDTSSQDPTQPPEPEDDDAQGPDQPGEDDGSRGLGDTSESVHDSTQVCGRPRVEIFKAIANFRVTDMTMAVLDGIRAQIIYMQKEEEEDQQKKSLALSQLTEPLEEMKKELVLTGPYRGISAYGNFAIQVDMPVATGGEGEPSSSGDAGGRRPIVWEWDGYNPKYAADVDAMEPVTHAIDLDSSGHKIYVTYLVMSNAVEATVEVKLRLQDDLEKPEDLPNEEGGGDGIAATTATVTAMEEEDDGGNKYTAHGTITAQIEDERLDRYPMITLFRRAEEEKEPIPSDSFIIPLARSVVQVPAGKRLRIGLENLHITESSSNQEVNKPDWDTLSFDIGHLRTPQVNNDSEVEVNVTWRPQQNMVETEPAHKVKLTYIIDNKDSFTSFVEELRRELARQLDHNEDVLEGYSGPDLPNTGKHPVLIRPRAKQALLWIHIKLPVVQGEETSSTTLAVRDDKCYGVGFMSRSGIWYDLGNRRGDMALPSEYNSVLLDWGVSYKDILGVSDWDEVVNKLQHATLGKAFAERAVRTLSSYPFVKEGESTRLALAGLLFMLCESAKFNRLHKLFADGWESGMVSSPSRVLEMDYSRNWGSISRALLHWKDQGFDTEKWCHDLGLQSIGISGPNDALDVLRLVFNNRDAPLNQGKMKVSFSKIEKKLPPPPISAPVMIPYTIGDKKGYVKFIEHLRQVLAIHKSGRAEYMVKDKPVLPEPQSGKQPQRWIHIELRVEEGLGLETSTTTTLVMRDDNLFVKGFKNREGKWLELCRPNETEEEKLPAEYYKAEELKGWGNTYIRILGLNDRDQVEKTLTSTRLGKDFAERAVRRLSRYDPDSRNEYNDDMPVRLGLAGLILMICEAARMDALLQHFAGQAGNKGKQRSSELGAWDRGQGLDRKLVGFIRNWRNMSAALLKRRDNPFRHWDSRCGVDSAEEALDCVHLVLNSYKAVKGPGGGGAQVVEILDVWVNFSVLEIKLIDEAQLRHKIYTTQKPDDWNNQKDNEMNRLQLTVPGKCISGHKWFAIEVVTPASTDAGDSITREFKFDCGKHAAGDATEFVTSTIDLDSWRKIQVSYLVMSNAVEATVEVKLWLNGGENVEIEEGGGDPVAGKEGGGGSKKYTAHGKITAHIGGFEGHPIVLFERSVEKPITLESALTFPLDRSTIHVPQVKQLQIDMNGLGITETSRSNSLQLEPPKVVKIPYSDQDGNKVSFPFGESRSDIHAVNDSVFQVDVTWAPQKQKPYEPEPDAVFTIGDKKFTEFIDEVRKVFAGQEFELSDEALLSYPNVRENDPLGGNQEPQPSIEDLNGKLFLTRPCPTNGQPEQWIHVELRVEGLSTTLAVLDGKCYGVGFMNQSQVWYDLGHGNQGCDKALPPEYNSVLLGWGVSYKNILGVEYWEQVPVKLNKAGLGNKSFAVKAVRTLSRYPDVEEDDLNLRVALAGLLIMVCESARFNPVLKYFQDNWNNDTETGGFSRNQMEYIRSWDKISRALLLWNDAADGKWPHDDDQTLILNDRGITSGVALAAVRLVYSDARAIEFHSITDSDERIIGSTTVELECC